MNIRLAPLDLSHHCTWFHSADYQHNISCCGIHEVDTEDGKYIQYQAIQCPKCAKEKP